MLRSASSLEPGHQIGPTRVSEEVGVALLRTQVVSDNLSTDARHLGDLAALGLEDREHPASLASRARRMVSSDAAPHPSGQGTNTWR